MTDDNKLVNGLWIGKELSKIELLTIHSFLKHGHTFRLWLYEPLLTTLPIGVEIGDASTVIPKEKVFAYKNANKYGHGKGSYAGFSDVFRYKLLYEYGGWWVDMDITCLKPFSFQHPYFFRTHHELMVVGNVLKCPPKSNLMKLCFEQASLEINENNTDWHKPIDILNFHITSLQLEHYIVRDISNQDKWEITSKYIWSKAIPPNEWCFIHWQNEEWRYKKISKNNFYYSSAIGKLLKQYNLITGAKSTLDRRLNEIKFLPFFR